jgi:hypothetical protein
MIKRRIAKLSIALLLCAGVLFPGLSFEGIRVSARAQYYLSPTGDDANTGTRAQPWKTLKYAITQLAPGDVLYLRGGSYFEHDLILNLKGTASQPIVIQSYPGERAIIDGGMPDFQSAPNQQWVLVDSNLQLYRSKQPVDYNDRLGGWLLDDDIQLMRYAHYAQLTTTKYDAPNNYLGPGVHGRGGYVYIRLQQNPTDLTDRLGQPLPPVPAKSDPNQLRINIFSSQSILIFQDAAYVQLRNLDIGPAYYTVEIRSPSHHIEIDKCRLTHKNASVLSRDGTSHIDIHHSEVDMGFPPWIYWGDVKGQVKPAYDSGWNSFAITGVWQNSRIHHNTIWNSFDGIYIAQGSINSQVTENTVIRSRDDAIDLNPNVANIEVGWNTIRHSFEGISLNSSERDTPLGEVYIHHNIIDVSAYHRAERTGDCEDFCTDWFSGIAFGGHGCNGGNCYLSMWNIYNNTIVARNSSPLTTEIMNHIMYNNVIYRIGSRLFRPLPQSGGNVFWRTEGGLSGFSEPAGLEVDPGFYLKAIEEQNDAVPGLRDLYRPTNRQLSTPGISYADLDWPGTQDVTYRGAVPPFENFIYLPAILSSCSHTC